MLSFSSCGQDTDLVSQILEEEGYNIESAIFAVLQVKELEKISKYTEFVTWCFIIMLSDVSVPCKQQFSRDGGGRSLLLAVLPPQPFCAQEGY